ncbi:MAG TPA: hypothetical protein VL463_29800 [Kofleriaceae bacterium]|nr:hypothetical protein [Kofleriaceae bacterium]
MKALDERNGSRLDEDFEDFAARVDARITRGEVMDNVTTETSGATDGVPPRMEDSGLHDIKALAKTTRQRVSRRNTSQHDVDERLLAESQSGLHMVALPEPAKLVSLPSIDELAKTSHEPAIARAAEKVAAQAAGRSRRSPMPWIAGAVVAAAAAVVGVIVIKNGGSKNEPQAAVSAGSGSAIAAGGAAATPGPMREETAKQTVAGAVAPPTPPAGDTGMAMGSGSASGSAAGSASSAPEMHTVSKTAPDKGHADKPKIDTQKVKGDGPTTNVVKKKNPNEPKTLDDLIDEAAGGSGAGSGSAKKTPDESKPALEKKELTSQDIRTAMGSVAKRAQACYDKFNQAGTVGVKASVAPSGSITKVTITGAFAGTPTGDCVQSVVQGVSFPAWDGAPMTVNYSYLLTE